jgi:hypothetical protein
MMMVLIASCILANGCQTGTGGQPGGDGGSNGTSDQLTGRRIVAPASIARGGIGVGGISTFALGDALAGELSPAMFLDGKPSCLTTVDGQARLAINSAGELLALARFAGDCDGPDSFLVNVYADATRLNGTQQPVRTAVLEDPIAGFGEFIDMAIDQGRDLLYVSSIAPEGDNGPDRIYVYEATTQSSFDETVTPIRTILLPDSINIFTLVIGTDDTLYVLGGGVSRITNASTRDGTLPDDAIDTIALGRIQDITVDSQNRLWMLRENPQMNFDPFTGNILRIDEDFIDAELNVLISFAGFPKFIRIDSLGTVYLYVSGELRIFDDIGSGSADEETPPSRTATNLRFEAETPFIIAD